MERNRSGDIEERLQLTSMGWHCLTVWECQLEPKVRQQTLAVTRFAISVLRIEESNHTRRLKKNMTWWQNPLKVMANRND